MNFAALLLSLATLCSFAAPAPEALDAKAAEWAAKGYRLKDRVSRIVDGVLVAAAVYASSDGSGDRLEAYAVLKGKAYLGYTHPAAAERLELDDTPSGRGFQDLFKDGSSVIAYRSMVPVLHASSLQVLRYKRFKFKRIAEFPEGRFEPVAGKTLLVSRDLPLGRFLAVGCENFGTVSRTAFRTRLHVPQKGVFADVSAEHPDYYAREIERKTRIMDRLKGDLQKNAGEYLGLALSVYYDYSARGEARKGWSRQKEFFILDQIPAYAQGKVRACFSAMRRDLRKRLAVPADWP